MLKRLWLKTSPKAKSIMVVGLSLTALSMCIYLMVRTPPREPLYQAPNTDEQIKILNTERLDDFTIASLSNSLEAQQNLINQQQQRLEQLSKQLETLTQQLGQTKQDNLPSLATLDTQGLSAEDYQAISELWESMVGLEPLEQCAHYYEFIQRYPHLRLPAFEKLINFNLAEWENGGKQGTIFTETTDPLKDYTVPDTDNLVNSQVNSADVFAQDPVTTGQGNANANDLYANQSYGNQSPANQYDTNQGMYLYNPPPTTYSSPAQAEPPVEPLTIRSLGTETASTPVLNLPAGSVFTGTIVTGVDAPTTDGAKADPYPVLVRLDNLDFLPNSYRSNLDACFMLLSSHGDISSHRALMRMQTLSCINAQGYIVEGEVKGYAVGEDGKIGVAGRLVSKQGSLIAKTLTIGFLQGISEAFTRPNLLLPGIGTYSNSPSASDIVTDAAFGGASKAVDRVANFYLNLANKMFPMVEVQAGVKVDLVVTAPISLQVSDRKVHAQPLTTVSAGNSSLPGSQIRSFSAGGTSYPTTEMPE
ncbi:TraB/VirB10 family protein [Psittacicella hinzii]|uniref:Conjugal transfer pilus assembly protein TraB n=1 Tax=Psittacicella hinzii TaxID=2028575 RepID=A0A3A1YF13_9GAMM|nr:TraB/VirB10 family protein [Psittacicella hinzii]RIY36752.1 hypothetical protein CKF58_05750 [Psittacicella hinzii]